MLLVIFSDQLDQPGHGNPQLFVSAAADSLCLWLSQKHCPWLIAAGHDRGTKAWTLCPVSVVRFMLQILSCIKPRLHGQDHILTWFFPLPYPASLTPVQGSPEYTPSINPCHLLSFQGTQPKIHPYTEFGDPLFCVTTTSTSFIFNCTYHFVWQFFLHMPISLDRLGNPWVQRMCVFFFSL